MWKKLKNLFIQYDLEESIEYYSELLDAIVDEIEIEYESLNIEVPKKLIAKEMSLVNIIRRIKKIKEKYK